MKIYWGIARKLVATTKGWPLFQVGKSIGGSWSMFGPLVLGKEFFEVESNMDDNGKNIKVVLGDKV